MNAFKITLFFLFSVITTWAYAQTDYVILKDGTKVSGEVRSHNFKKVKFVAAGSKKAKAFKPADISEAYHAGDQKFRSVELPGKRGPYFLELLQDGKIKLYELFKGGSGYRSTPSPYAPTGFALAGSAPSQYWYAQKDNGELVEVKSNQIWGSRKARKDRFLALIADNPHIAGRYNAEDKFTFDFILSLVEEYNSQVKGD